MSVVEKAFLQTNTQKQSVVQENVQVSFAKVKSIQLDGCEDVYNMEVEDNHNFAINGGYIVHNCMDSMRYFVKTMKLVPKDR